LLTASKIPTVKVLIVEDDPELAQALAAALRRQKWVVDIADSLSQAELLALGAAHDVVVLDRGLPDGDGLTLIDTLRAAGVQLPVLVLTAMNAVPDRVSSLDRGADDYLAKPFAIDELLARLRALVRRPAAARNRSALAVGRLSLDPDARQLLAHGIPLILPRRELLVLETLMLHKGLTVQRERLQSRVFGDGEDIRSNTLDAHVSRLRSKLEKIDAQVEIHSIRGVGYLLRTSPKK
jgi:two-component system OmpR family response regulator